MCCKSRELRNTHPSKKEYQLPQELAQKLKSKNDRKFPVDKNPRSTYNWLQRKVYECLKAHPGTPFLFDKSGATFLIIGNSWDKTKD